MILQNRASEGCTVLTDFQTAGRGQRGNQWEAAPAENLMLSVVWQPTFLAATDQFRLSQAVALGVYDWASTLLSTTPKLKLKWPNDLLYGTQKLGGILINTLSGSRIQHSIIGIGLNINQQEFAIATATSIGQITGRASRARFWPPACWSAWSGATCSCGPGSWPRFGATTYALYRFQESHPFIVNGDMVHEIVGVEDDGRLAVQIGNDLRRFGLQEIRHT